MAFVIRFIKTVRNNWKKSVLFVGVTAYGINYGKGVYEDSVIRKAYCEEARAYGNQPLKTGERARRVTVFLNPAAKKGSARKLFDKNVAPILNLAGLEVTVIRTEYEGQAKKYMDVLEETDAIVVAGGDGTLSEVVTGLLRRKDEAVFSKIPIGIIPLGYTNTVASILHKKDKSDAKWMLDAALSVVKGTTRPVDIMKITDKENRTVFAVNSLEWSAFKEAQNRASKYWYFGPLKHRWTYLMSAVGRWPPVVQGHLSYTESCSGCSKCYKPPPKQQWKWWHIFLSPKVEVPTKDYSEIYNPQCGVEHELDFSSVELTAFINQPTELNSRKDNRGIILSLGPSSVEKMAFIKEGWQRLKESPSKEWRETKTVEQFVLHPEGEQSHDYFVIDNEQYEIMPVTVRILRDKINIFYMKSS